MEHGGFFGGMRLEISRTLGVAIEANGRSSNLFVFLTWSLQKV